jgi:hypothetical protein
LARFGSGTARMRVGDRGYLKAPPPATSPPQWELRSEGRRLQPAFRKLETLQETRGDERIGRGASGRGEWKRAVLCPLLTSNRQTWDTFPQSSRAVGKLQFPTLRGWPGTGWRRTS